MKRFRRLVSSLLLACLLVGSGVSLVANAATNFWPSNFEDWQRENLFVAGTGGNVLDLRGDPPKLGSAVKQITLVGGRTYRITGTLIWRPSFSISIHSARVGGDGIDYGRGNRAANQLELKAEVGAVSAFLSLDRGFHLFYNTNVGKLIDKLPSHIRIMKTGGQNIVGDSGEILYGDSACQINIESSTGAIQLKEEK